MRKITKKTTKKTAKKTTKRTPRKKALTLNQVVEAARDAGAKVEVEIESDKAYAESADQACAGTSEALRGDTLGSYASMGFLDANAVDPVQKARKDLTFTAQQLMQAAVKMSDTRHERVSVRDVVKAEQRLAIARFELAVDELERAIRG